MKITWLILFVSFFFYSVNAQYVDEEGRVDKEKLLTELKLLENWSPEQDTLKEKIFDKLVEARQNHPKLIQSKDKRDKITLTIIELGNLTGDFFFLNPNNRNSPHYRRNRIERRRADTVSHDLEILKQDLARFQDSLAMVYDAFKRIIESSNETRASKEKAVHLLATSNDLEDIDYLFANNRFLSFGTISEHGMNHWNSHTDEELLLSTRTGMVALSKAKFHKEHQEIDFINWIILPYFIKYWGDPEWVIGNTYIELIMILNMMREYKEPWHLMRFIKANVESTDTKIMEMIEQNRYTEEK